MTREKIVAAIQTATMAGQKTVAIVLTVAILKTATIVRTTPAIAEAFKNFKKVSIITAKKKF